VCGMRIPTHEASLQSEKQNNSNNKTLLFKKKKMGATITATSRGYL
jgi:hypothetical protein